MNSPFGLVCVLRVDDGLDVLAVDRPPGQAAPIVPQHAALQANARRSGESGASASSSEQRRYCIWCVPIWHAQGLGAGEVPNARQTAAKTLRQERHRRAILPVHLQHCTGPTLMP